MYLIIQLVVFFSILLIDVNRNRKFLILVNEVGASENPKILKNFFIEQVLQLLFFYFIFLLELIFLFSSTRIFK